MVSAFIALGANLGDPVAAIGQALEDLDALDGVTLSQRSSLYRTAPLDSSGPDYVNAVAEILTTLCAPALLIQLQQLESRAGRERPYRNAPRVLDLDILTYGEGRISSETLQLPHPRMNERAFVLLPLAEIAPQRVSAAQLRRVAAQRITRM